MTPGFAGGPMPGKKKEESTSRPAGLEQMRALSHPLRLRLLELFAERPRTTKQAAEALGEPTTKLYHHVAALERAGLVRLRETRQNRGTTEKYFEVTQSQFLTKADPALLQNEEAQAVMGFVLFDQAREELVRALSSSPRPGTVVAVAASCGCREPRRSGCARSSWRLSSGWASRAGATRDPGPG